MAEDGTFQLQMIMTYSLVNFNMLSTTSIVWK